MNWLFLVYVLFTWCQYHVNKAVKENGGFGAKTVPRNHANKNTSVMNHMDMLTGWVDVSKYNGVTSPGLQSAHVE